MFILLDEFDKVSPSFYNAFYQMFDEGTLSIRIIQWMFPSVLLFALRITELKKKRKSIWGHQSIQDFLKLLFLIRLA